MTLHQWHGSFTDLSERIANHLAEIALAAVVLVLLARCVSG